MVRVWLLTVVLLFGLVELYQWVRGFILPLPIYVLAGAFLAIASNYNKGIGSFLEQDSAPEPNFSQTATLETRLLEGDGESRECGEMGKR
jgi:hypothetical protein